jgi:hypothetical protein
MTCKVITSVLEIIGEVNKVLVDWGYESTPWFRGEPRDVLKPLLPRLFRVEDGRRHDELKLLQHFRMKAPSLGLPYVPQRGYVDQWLFLAQHVGLPTRLLDWTEGLMIALHFALYTHQAGAIIWMLNPNELNKLTVPDSEEGETALTWFSLRNIPLKKEDLAIIQNMIKKKGVGKMPDIAENIGSININMAWTKQGKGTTYPVAIHPTNIHPRMSSQISRFTIHGERENEMCNMGLSKKILRRFQIADEAIPDMKRGLRIMGITHSSLFPELDGLSEELASIY